MTVMELAKEDSQITGDRFVVEHEGSPCYGKRWCCVVDSLMETIVAEGILFSDACKLAAQMNEAHVLRPNEKLTQDARP